MRRWPRPARPVRPNAASDPAATRFTVRSLTATYALALLIIAGLSLATHTILQSALGSAQGTAAVINEAGRQRMLSQRITSLAAQRRLGDAGATAPLAEATDLFEAAHARLAAPYRADSDKPGPHALHALYFEGPAPLDARMRSFVADARTLLRLPADDPAATPVLDRLFTQARTVLLDNLNEATMIQQRETEQRFAYLEWLQSVILGVVLTTLVVEALLIFRPMIDRIMRQLREILQLATTDPLTQLDNRRSFYDRGLAERARAAGRNEPVCVILLDVDYFKQVNDTHGHAAGDAVLRALGETLRANTRKDDVVGRLGGEEFGIVLPRTGLQAAAALAERIRHGIEAMRVPIEGHSLRVTVSVGVGAMDGRADTIDSALQRVDRLMYRAKAGGRNRVIVQG